jgi:hypothetical protein
VNNVGPDVAVAALDELLDLLKVGVDDSGPARPGEAITAGVAGGNPLLDGLVVASGELAGGPVAGSGRKSFEDLHPLVRFGQRLPPSGGSDFWTAASKLAGGAVIVDFGEI